MDHRAKELLYETLQLFRKEIQPKFQDWKDADSWLFSSLQITKSELQEIYDGKTDLIYIASAPDDPIPVQHPFFIMDERFSEEERDVLISAKNAGLSAGHLNFIVSHSADWLEMDEISVGFKLGIPLGSMEALLSDEDGFKKLAELTNHILRVYKKQNMEKASDICRDYMNRRSYILSPAAKSLHAKFQDMYRESGYKYSGCIKLNDILSAGYKEAHVEELLSQKVIFPRDTQVVTYELSPFERMALISEEHLEEKWSEKDGSFFLLNNGYYGEIQSLLRSVLTNTPPNPNQTLDSMISNAISRSGANADTGINITAKEPLH